MSVGVLSELAMKTPLRCELGEHAIFPTLISARSRAAADVAHVDVFRRSASCECTCLANHPQMSFPDYHRRF